MFCKDVYIQLFLVSLSLNSCSAFSGRNMMCAYIWRHALQARPYSMQVSYGTTEIGSKKNSLLKYPASETLLHHACVIVSGYLDRSTVPYMFYIASRFLFISFAPLVEGRPLDTRDLGMTCNFVGEYIVDEYFSIAAFNFHPYILFNCACQSHIPIDS